MQVNYLITTEGEIHVNTVKIQEAKVKGLPMLSEEVLSDAVSTGAFPDDLSDYLLKGSPPLKKTAAKKSATAGPKKTRAAKTLEEADAEADEEEEAPKAKRGAAAAKATKATAAKVTKAAAKATAKATAAAGKALNGLTFAISGTLSEGRAHWEDLISSAGGRLAGSVTNAVRIQFAFHHVLFLFILDAIEMC